MAISIFHRDMLYMTKPKGSAIQQRWAFALLIEYAESEIKRKAICCIFGITLRQTGHAELVI